MYKKWIPQHQPKVFRNYTASIQMNDSNFHFHLWNSIPVQAPVVPQTEQWPTCDLWNSAQTGTSSTDVTETGQRSVTKITEGDGEEHWESMALPTHHFHVWTKMIQRYLSLFLTTTRTKGWRCQSTAASFPIPYAALVSSLQKSTRHDF